MMSEFNSKGEIKDFFIRHTPIAVKPKKIRKYKLVKAFTSANAFDQVVNELTEKMFEHLNQKDNENL